jgi:hypothetical protein
MAGDGSFDFHVVGCRFWGPRRSATCQQLIDLDVKEPAQPSDRTEWESIQLLAFAETADDVGGGCPEFRGTSVAARS